MKVTRFWTIWYAYKPPYGVFAAYSHMSYQERGIFEAIEKQYLRRFIFAIYLVSSSRTSMRHCSKPNRIAKTPTSSIVLALLLSSLLICRSIVEAYTFNFQVGRIELYSFQADKDIVP